jgi:hypothetical protein
VKNGEPVDWRYDLGEDVYVVIKAPQLRIHTRKYFVPNGEWTLHLTKRGMTLQRYRGGGGGGGGEGREEEEEGEAVGGGLFGCNYD